MYLGASSSKASPPYLALTTDITTGHIRCRAVAIWSPPKNCRRWLSAPVTLTTATTVATLVLAPLIQVSLAPSVVPVLPIIGTKGSVLALDCRPVPLVITRCIA